MLVMEFVRRSLDYRRMCRAQKSATGQLTDLDRASIAVALQDWPRASRLLARLSRSSDEVTRRTVKRYQVVANLETGAEREALATADTLITEEAPNPYDFVLRARVLSALARYDEAEADLRQAVERSLPAAGVAEQEYLLNAIDVAVDFPEEVEARRRFDQFLRELMLRHPHLVERVEARMAG